MRMLFRTAAALALIGALALGSAGAGAASPTSDGGGASTVPSPDFGLVDTWDFNDQETSWGMLRSMVQSPTGDLFLVGEGSGPGLDGVVKLSSSGEILGGWDFLTVPYEPLRSATMAVGADVDSGGNLHLALQVTEHVEHEDGYLVRSKAYGQLVTYSSDGVVLGLVELDAGATPSGVTHVDGVTYVASHVASETSVWGATQVAGYDADGAKVSEAVLDDMRVASPYGSFAHTSDGRLLLLAEADGVDADGRLLRTVVVLSRDGVILDRWVAQMTTEWTQEELEGTDLGVINDEPWPMGIAVGADDDVILTNGGLGVEVLALDGSRKQTLLLPGRIDPIFLKVRTLGTDGRLYVFHPREMFVYERPVPSSEEAALWTATQCVAFTDQVAAPSGGQDVSFEVTQGSLPEGTALDPTTGVVSGTSVAAGEHTVTITAYDGRSEVASQTVVLTVLPGVLTSVSVPVITGEPVVGRTLTASAESQPAVALDHQWLRDGQPITGALDAQYVLTADDVDAAVTVRVTAAAGCPATAEAEAVQVSDTPGPAAPAPSGGLAAQADPGTAPSISAAPGAGPALAQTGLGGIAAVAGSAALLLSGFGLLRARRRTASGR